MRRISTLGAGDCGLGPWRCDWLDGRKRLVVEVGMDTSKCLRLTIEYAGEGFWFSHFVKPASEYEYSIDWSAEDGEYVGLCSRYPSLSWLAETPEEALRGIQALVAGIQREGI